jgi:DNA-binding response OmpR family regulator
MMSGPITIPKHKTRTAKVLVIDDEPEITEVIETFLESSGYQVLCENSSMMAVERARDYKPDLILLDIMMAGMDGYQICEELKKDANTQNIPILFLTGKDSRDDSGKSFKVGGDMFIKKPFSGDRLLEIINIVLVSIGKR